ncbi:MAG TPA: hypothetical protein VGM62_19150 [Chthoniobacterales bacterium]
MSKVCICRFTAFIRKNHGATINGFKIRELFVRPHAAERKFFYGLNSEFSVNALYWESRRITSEIRPIIGLHLHWWDFIYTYSSIATAISPNTFPAP